MAAEPADDECLLVGAYEFELTRGGYTVWHAESLVPIAQVNAPVGRKFVVAMERSGQRFRSPSLEAAATTIAWLYQFGL